MRRVVKEAFLVYKVQCLNGRRFHDLSLPALSSRHPSS